MNGERTVSYATDSYDDDPYLSTHGAPPVGSYPIKEEPSLSELINGLTEDFSYLVRKEVELARTETMEKINAATRSVVLMIAAGLLAYAGFIVLLITAGALLYSVIGVYWIASLIVGVAVFAVAAILFFAGRSALSTMSFVPEKTIESLKEDAQWVKDKYNEQL